MSKLIYAVLAAVPVLAAGCAYAGQSTAASAGSSKAAQAASAAPRKTDCVDLIRIDRTEVLDDQTILFHMKGGQVWRNRLPYKCPQLGFEKAFTHRTSINRLCSIDTITVLHTGSPILEGATCGLGEFEAYTPEKKAQTAKPEEPAKN